VLCKAYDSAARAADFGQRPPPAPVNAHHQSIKVGDTRLRPSALPLCCLQGVCTYKQAARWLQDTVGRAVVRVARYLKENEYLLVVAASTMIMSLSHTALRPVLPVFAKARPANPAARRRCTAPALLKAAGVRR